MLTAGGGPVHWFWDTQLRRISSIVAIAVACTGLGSAAAATLDLAQLPLGVQKGLIFVVIAVLLPTTSVLFLMVVARPTTQHVAGEVAKDLLEACLANVQFFALDLRRETGPDFLTAQQKQHAVIVSHIVVSQGRFLRDKRHLEFLTGSGNRAFLSKFIEMKSKAIEAFENARHQLAHKCSKHDDARHHILEAGGILKHCADEMQIAVNNFTWSS